jgi:hypothetical protein
MLKFLIALVLVIAVVASGLVALRRSARLPLPSQDVLDRVKRREQELQARDRLERGD